MRRKLSLGLYAEETNLLYETIDSEADLPSDIHLSFSNPELVLRGLRGAVEEQTGWKPEADNDDLFHSGLDSLQALNLTRRINAASGLATLLDPRDVYSHPTVKGLADLICEKCGIAYNGMVHHFLALLRINGVTFYGST